MELSKFAWTTAVHILAKARSPRSTILSYLELGGTPRSILLVRLLLLPYEIVFMKLLIEGFSIFLF